MFEADGTVVSYKRDVTGRIVHRTESKPGGLTTITRFGFAGDGDSPDYVYDGNSVARVAGGVDVWQCAGVVHG